jgi:hypothetical protein
MIKWSIYDKDWRPLCPEPLLRQSDSQNTSDDSSALAEFQCVQDRVRLSKKRILRYFEENTGMYRTFLVLTSKEIEELYETCETVEDVTDAEYLLYWRLFDPNKAEMLSWSQNVLSSITTAFTLSTLEENLWLNILTNPVIFLEIVRHLDCKSIRSLACVCGSVNAIYVGTKSAVLQTFSADYKHYAWICKSVSGEKHKRELKLEMIRERARVQPRPYAYLFE